MIFQNRIWLISLLGMGLVTLCFIFVIAQAGSSADTVQTARFRRTFDVVRRWLFGALLLLFVLVTFFTLRAFPIPLQHSPLTATQVVNVTGQQWSWNLSATRIQAGVPVEFRVTSADVNHGFAIYAPDGRIVTETQAMPGYINKLLYTFRQPGIYTIRCLEYCGLAHHGMETEIEVVGGTSADTGNGS